MSLESRIVKLEELLGAPECVCGNRREGFVILNEINGPSRAELLAMERECFWDCPAHGPSQVNYLLHICLSQARSASEPGRGLADRFEATRKKAGA